MGCASSTEVVNFSVTEEAGPFSSLTLVLDCSGASSIALLSKWVSDAGVSCGWEVVTSEYRDTDGDGVGSPSFW